MSVDSDLDKNVEKEYKEVVMPAKSDYKKTALFDALVSPDFDCKLDIFRRLLKQYVPIIDSVIPSASIFKLDKTNNRAGNTLLHVAKVYDEAELFDTLIKHGADFTLKDNNGSPMLKLTAKDEYNNYFEMKVGGHMPNKKFIDKILSAHVAFENINNPSDENGISHFHFACMNNRPEVVEFFLNNGVAVGETVHTDSPIYAGYTPLHFAVKYCAVETVQLLLKYGADPKMKDSKGLNPLHVLIDEKINTWSQITRILRAMGTNDYSGLEKFHQKIEIIIIILLEKNYSCCNSNLYDDTGLSYLHVMSTMQNLSDVVKFLDNCQVDMNQKTNANSTLWPGYTAIHFAAHFEADTVRLLMHRGADLASEDASGMTPFDICLNGMELLDIHSILYLNSDLSNIRFSDGTTKLSDFLLGMRTIRECVNYMKYKVGDANMFIPFDSPICAGYTALHLCMICSETPRNFHPENVDHNLPSSQFLRYKSRILQCRIKNVNLYATDSRGRTPIHWAFHLQETYQVMDLLMSQSQVNIPNVIDDRGLSILHIACAAHREAVVKQLLSNGANVNEATKSSHALYEFFSVCGDSKALLQPFVEGSTPLHIAVIVECLEIVEHLIGRHADVFAEDVDALTPLERCLGKSVFGKTMIPSWKIRSSPLSDRQIRISELLILRASQLLVDTRSDEMLYCYSLLSAETLDKLLSNDNEPMRKILISAGITMLHVACFLKNPQQVEEQLKAEANVNAKVDLTSPLWPGCTPLHILMNLGKKQMNYDVAGHLQIVILLFRYGADVAATDDMGSTPLHSVFQSYLNNNADHFFLDMFLHHITDFSVNPTNAKGLTHLHAACARNNSAVVRKFMEHGADTEQAVDYFDHKYGGFTALHFAAAFRSEKVVDILLSYGADVHREDVFDRNPLHVAVEMRGQASVQIFRSLVSAGAKMNAVDVFGERPLEKLIRNSEATNEEIAIFVEHNCRINKWNPMTNEGCLAIALEIDRAPIFQTIIQAVDIKKISSNGRNAIHNIVSINEPDWDSYDEDDPIEEIFIPADNYTVAIETLIELGLNINHQDNRGFTPLHEAASRSNVTGIVGLLNNGANINLVNTNGESAFALSLGIFKSTSEMRKVDEEIFAFISAYMYKLNLIGAEISKSNLEVWMEITKIISLKDSWYLECCNEFERMKSLKIGGYTVTLEDFFSDTGAVSSYPFMLSNQRNVIDKFFESESSKFELEFPKFNKLLILQHKKAKARLQLIMPAEKSINYHVGFTIPPICSRIIIRFLNNEQLNNLIMSAVE